ncbi:unnamed protein product, partial [marine sediment metagenome]
IKSYWVLQMSKVGWSIVLIMAILLLLSMITYSVDPNWVSNMTQCPAEDQGNFSGQNCFPQVICGDNTGIAQCTNNASATPPADAFSSTDQDGALTAAVC